MPASESKLRITERQAGDVTVLALAGEMTVDDGDIAFGRRVEELIKQGRVKIVVNLADVSYIDSAGVGRMVVGAKMLHAARGVMKLASPTDRTRRLLTGMKLISVFQVFDDEESAVQSFSSERPV